MVGRPQHEIRTVSGMPRLPSLIRGLGAAGATANARAELESEHVRCVQAALLVKHLESSGRGHQPLGLAAAEARVA